MEHWDLRKGEVLEDKEEEDMEDDEIMDASNYALADSCENIKASYSNNVGYNYVSLG